MNRKPWIKSIDTEYNGMLFRSRLEARWAVFFDVAGIKYEYEPEGFEHHGYRYLPDFYLPELDTYVEVKPDREGLAKDIIKARRLIYWGGPIKRLVFLGNIPGPNKDGEMWYFPCLYYTAQEIGFSFETGWFYFYDDYGTIKNFNDKPTKCIGGIDTRDLTPAFAIDGFVGNESVRSYKWEQDPQRPCHIRLSRDITTNAVSFPDCSSDSTGYKCTQEEIENLHPCTFAAYKEARCARFEFKKK